MLAQAAVLFRRTVETAAVVDDAENDAVEARARARSSPRSPPRDARRSSGSPARCGRRRARHPGRASAAPRRTGARPRTPETRANVVDSSVSALTRPRCSSISGRSSLEMRRTSSSARRTASLASSISARCVGRRSRRSSSSCSSTPVSSWPTSSCRSRAIADPLGLLRGEHAPAALLALALEPVEHAVEGPDDAADLVVALDRQPLARPQQVDGLHAPRQPLERRERASQQDSVGAQRDREPADDDQRLRRA